MNYATIYDVGERKRDRGINEDSVSFVCFDHGHREGRVDVEMAGGGANSEDSKAAADSKKVDSVEGDSKELDADTEPAATDPTNSQAAVVVLADGAGGYDAGDVASYIATTVIAEELASVAIQAERSRPDRFEVDLSEPLPDGPQAETIQAAIEDAITTAHRRILEYVTHEGQPAYTTVVAGIVVNGEFHYGWVGDSRAYVINRKTESIAQLTKDHSVVTDLYEGGEIDEIESYVHPRGNEITRAIGGDGREDPETATVAVETDTIDLFAEDIVLVTSDGLIDAQTDASSLYESYLDSERSDAIAETVRQQVVTDDEIREWVLGADSLAAAAETLIDRANDRGGKDNLSAVLFEDSALPETPDESAVPQRGIDLSVELEQRETVIIPEE